MRALVGIINKVCGVHYDPTCAMEYFLHERFPILLSNNSDPLPMAEVETGFTYQYLSLLADLDVPLLFLSKFPAWGQLDRDKYMGMLHRFSRRAISVTLTGDNEDHAANWEPGAPSVAQRLDIVREFSKAGFPVEIQCVPVILESSFRGPWDDPGTYRPFIEQCAEAGAWGIHVGPLCFDRTDAGVLGSDVKAYLASVAWSNSQTDRRWRYYVPDVSIWQHVGAIWYEECHRVGLACAPHNAFAGLISDVEDTAFGLGCILPGWGSPASWVDLSRRLKQKQAEYGKPICLSTGQAAELLAAGLPWADHEFSWRSWRDALPGLWNDPGYVAEVNAMPEWVTAEQVIHFQLQHMPHWSDSLWGDLCVSPISLEPNTMLATREGNLIMYYDRQRPRDSWAVCRAPEGSGIPAEVALEARLYDGAPAFEEVTETCSSD